MKTVRAALLNALPVAVMMIGLSLAWQTAAAQNATPPNDASAQEQPAQQPDSSGVETKIFTGKIVRTGDKLVLTDAAGKMTYLLDDQQKAKSYLNKSVKVTGILDASTGTIRVSAIGPA